MNWINSEGEYHSCALEATVLENKSVLEVGCGYGGNAEFTVLNGSIEQSIANPVTVEIIGSIFDSVCREAGNQPRMHSQLGRLLTSALACGLAKTTGKPMSIKDESLQARTTTIKYVVGE